MKRTRLNGKGFAGVLLLFAIIIASGILLAANMQTREEYSFKELIPQTKAQLTSYALNLEQMSATCDWTKPASMHDCIDANAATLTEKISNCLVESQIVAAGSNYKAVIRCKVASSIGQASITLDVNKEVTISQ